MSNKLVQENRQRQTLSQRQTQTMDPYHLLLVRMTEKSMAELEAAVNEELNTNLALESTSEDEPSEMDVMEAEGGTEAEKTDDYDPMQDYANEDDVPEYLLSARYSKEEPRTMDFGSGSSVYGDLMRQLGEQCADEELKQVASYLIGSLNSDGFLDKKAAVYVDELSIYEGIDVEEEVVEQAIDMIQGFEPTGIGARNLQDCLLLQLKSMHKTREVELAIGVIENQFNRFINKHNDAIRRLMRMTDEDWDKVSKILYNLNPRPGSAFNADSSDVVPMAIPDFTVRQNNDGSFDVSLNWGEIPKLRVAPSYKNFLNGAVTTKDKDVIVDQIHSAQNFINALKQRQKTLLRVMTAIVELQREFFEEGDERLLKPMVLQDVAKKTGDDISTVSRVSMNKYVETDFGIFDLKRFFTNRFVNGEEGELSTAQVKYALAELVKNENPREPLSDDKLVKLLSEQGINVARRTITKYREKLGIPVARLRRK